MSIGVLVAKEGEVVVADTNSSWQSQVASSKSSPILQRAKTVLVTEQYCGKAEYELSLQNFFKTFGDNESSRAALEEAGEFRRVELRGELPTAAKTAAYSVNHPEGISEIAKERIASRNREYFLDRFSPIKDEAAIALNEAIAAERTR